MTARARRPRAARLLAGLVPAILIGGPAFAEQSTVTSAAPRVRLVATGGTIANRAGGRLTADDLARLVQVDRYARLETEQFANLASGQLSLEQFLGLARRLNQLFQTDEGLAGIVVTSGTDTLEELAYFLHLTVRSDRPVVVVGSMRRPDVPGYEGAANLLAAVRVAADPASHGRGVLVVMNDEIESAREVTKTDAQRLETFSSSAYGTLGVVDGDRVVYHRRPERRHTGRSEFEAGRIDTLPRVDVLLTYQGASGDLIRASVDAGARGIVVATAAGGLSGTQADGIRYALERRVVIVRATRTGGGRIVPGRAVGREQDPRAPFEGTVAAEDLTPIKARILLMLALTRTSDLREIQRMFSEY
jgi:L-asparaginase